MRYPNSFSRTHFAGVLQQQHAQTPAEELERLQLVVTLAGRLTQKNDLDGTGLGELQDRLGRIHLLVTEAAAGRANHAAFGSWKEGDIVGVTGVLSRLAGGALAVRLHEMERLVECKRPLPREGTGPAFLALLTDESARRTFEIRSRTIAGIRAYLGGTSYMEVETPLLQADPMAGTKLLSTHHNALVRELWLRSSAGTYLKRLLVGGVEKVYEINRTFSHQGSDDRHELETTLLEIYCAYSSHLYMMALLEQIVARAARHALGTTSVPSGSGALELGKPFRRLPAAEARGERLAQPTYVVDVPAREAPYARHKVGAPEVAEQFYLYLGGHRIAEGRSELNDPDEVAVRYNSEFARAVEYGLPPSSGLALSIDRLVMVLADADALGDVQPFALHAAG